jgi:hypothetical protein
MKGLVITISIVSLGLLLVVGLLALTPGMVNAALYAQSSSCNSSIGKVLTVTNDEIFSIVTCNEVGVFNELSYCYGVEEGDEVVFHWSPQNCELVSFTVLRNGVQCGVWCP